MPAWLGMDAAGLEARGLRRTLRPLGTGPEPWVLDAGVRCLHLASNNYLGLATDPRVCEAACAAVRRWGAGAGASRLITGHTDLVAGLEARLAALHGAEAALVYPSGYAANLGVLAGLAGPRDRVLADALSHASLIDGARLAHARLQFYRHADPDDLERRLGRGGERGRTFVVTDGVFSMDGDVAPLEALAEVAARHGACLVVDDAHGVGVLGERGAGAAEGLDVGGQLPLLVGTLSKALGSQGGYVAGSRAAVDRLVNRSRPLIYTTGATPAAAGAALAALDVLEAEPWRRQVLRRRAEQLRRGLRALGYALGPDAGTPITSVIVGEASAALRLAEELRSRRVLAPAIRPPTVPPGTSRLRVTVMATHSEPDLDFALDAFGSAAPAAGLPAAVPVPSGGGEP